MPSADTRSTLLGTIPRGASVEATIDVLERQVRSGDDEDANTLASLALAYLQRSRQDHDPTAYPRVESLLRRSLDSDATDNFEAVAGMSLLAAGRHDFTTALRWAERARKMRRGSSVSHALVGDALMELGRIEEAAASFHRMIDLRPDVGSYARISYLRQTKGDLRGATRVMRFALDAAAPDDTEAAFIGHLLADLHLSAGDTKAALFEFRRALYRQPNLVAARVGLAEVAIARGNLLRADRMLTRIVGEQDLGEAVMLLADVKRARGRDAAADRLVRRAWKLDDLFLSYGGNPEAGSAIFAADHAYPQRALTIARRVWARQRTAAAADALAWSLLKSGEAGVAERFARVALAGNPWDPAVRFHAGMIARALGQNGTARRNLSAAVDAGRFSILDPPAAIRALASL